MPIINLHPTSAILTNASKCEFGQSWAFAFNCVDDLPGQNIVGSGSWVVPQIQPKLVFTGVTYEELIPSENGIITSLTISLNYNSTSVPVGGFTQLWIETSIGSAFLNTNSVDSIIIGGSTTDVLHEGVAWIPWADFLYYYGETAGGPITYDHGSLDISNVVLHVTYTPAIITNVSPNSGGEAGGLSVQINGSGFDSGLSITEIRFGGELATNISIFSDTILTCDIPAHNAGAVDVTINFSDGTLLITKVNAFLYGAGDGWEQKDDLIKYGPPTDEWSPINSPISYNPITGDHILTTPDLTDPWIPWTPDSPIESFKLPVIITRDKIPEIESETIIPVLFIPIEFTPIDIELVEFNPIDPHWTEDPDNPSEPIIKTQAVPTDNGYTVNVGGAADIVFIGSPSGIYALIKGKTNDTLYDRTGIVSVDVKIPNPFIETSFLPE